MIKQLLKSINITIKNIFNITVISQDIDKNSIFPCFKVNIIDYKLNMISKNFFIWNAIISINYYPRMNIDKTLEFISIKEKLANTFIFGVGKFEVNDMNFNNDEDFLTMTLGIEMGIVYENEKGIGMQDIPYEIIKEIEIKLKNKEE